MNDDFLHRLRAEPSAKFLAALKASLDRQAISHGQARRTLFRTAILATLIGGSAVAMAFVAWKGLPASARFATRMSGAQDRASQSKIILSAPNGGGAPKVLTRAAGGDAPASALPATPVTLAMQPAPGSDRSRFSLAGPKAVASNVENVARRLGPIGPAKPLDITPASSTDAIAMLCHVHAILDPHPGFVDVAGASRRILPAELESCKGNGVTRVAELLLGYETVVLARSNLYGTPKLSARDIFLAMAAEVPDPNRPQSLIKNPYRIWNAIDGTLSEDKIEVFGPPPSSAIMAAFQQTLMEAGCATFRSLAALKQSDPKRYEQVCRTVRDDGVYKGMVPNLRAQLETYPNAMALEDFRDAGVQGFVPAAVDGVEPTSDTIVAGTYAGSRALYLYVNIVRAYTVPGALPFLAAYVKDVQEPWSFAALVPPRRQANAGNLFALEEMKF
ncbi:MAG TPA: substrate-binding domain-containing protein [Steroidobacteraceae bacterium]